MYLKQMESPFGFLDALVAEAEDDDDDEMEPQT